MKTCLFNLVVMLLTFSFSYGQNLAEIKLPEPQMNRGRPLMQVLKDRQTVRSFKTDMLSRQELSNVLWAAWGINRAESGKRTAPSWANWKEIEIYVATADGVYLYNAQEHKLVSVINEDIRGGIRKFSIKSRVRRFATNTKDFVAIAPVSFIYVADYTKMKWKISDEEKRFIAGTDTGFISQNVYLYCASEGLATVVLGGIDRDGLHKSMQLPGNKHVIYAQAIGYWNK